MTVVRKVTVARAAGDSLEFVLSDTTKDRYGDVIDQAGWVLANFKKNPIALFGHRSDFPIGTWSDVRVDAGRLIGKLNLAAEGTSDRLNEIIRLVAQGILRAVSVGFQVIESEPLPDKSGVRFLKQELIETSLVSVPANPSAVQLARSLHVSDDTIDLVFGKHASTDGTTACRGLGEHAAHSSSPGRAPKMLTIAKRIENAQTNINTLRDQLSAHIEKHADNLDETASAVAEDLNAKIAAEQRTLDVLKASETSLASSSDPAREVRSGDRRPFAVAAKKTEPKAYAYRAATIKLLSHITKEPADLIRVRHYGEDEATKAVADVMLRAATAPAMTSTSGWASQLVQQVNADFMEDLMPASVYPGLSAKGLRLNFGRNGVISIPSRVSTPTIAGSFVGEGAPIPVRQGALASTTLTPKKMAVISTFTREIAEHSAPAIEGLIRAFMQEDTAIALDSVLLDNNAATTIRPAGLRNGVTAITAATGGGFDALVADIKALVGALITATNGNIRQPVWIMNPVQAVAIGLTQNTAGDFPFKQEMSNGQLQGYPVLQSASVTAGMLILVDAADYVSVTGDEPRFDVSDQATLHMEDTTPLAISAAGTPNTVAAPIRSMFQTDSLAIRMILPINWALRRAGVVAWTQSVTW